MIVWFEGSEEVWYYYTIAAHHDLWIVWYP